MLVNNTDKNQLKNKIYKLLLFIAGGEPNSMIASKNITKICKTYIPDNYELEVVDIFKNLKKAIEYDILITPTLIISDSKNKSVLVGNFYNYEKLLKAIDVSSD